MDSIFPDSFAAGLTFNVLATSLAYPASDGWTLHALLRGPSSIDITSTPEANQHRLAVAASTTATWTPGAYSYAIRATLGADVEQVEAGHITIKPDQANVAVGTETRSHARITLDNIEAVIEKRATQDQQRYSINNRELWRTPISDLLKLRGVYRTMVQQEINIERGRSIFGRSIGVRFKNPT